MESVFKKASIQSMYGLATCDVDSVSGCCRCALGSLLNQHVGLE